MKVFRYLHRLTAFVGLALIFLACCCEDWNAILSFAKWGMVLMIPSAVYMLAEKVRYEMCWGDEVE